MLLYVAVVLYWCSIPVAAATSASHRGATDSGALAPCFARDIVVNGFVSLRYADVHSVGGTASKIQAGCRSTGCTSRRSAETGH
jgi:hypothetical protein